MEEPSLYSGVTAQVQPVVYYPLPDGANPAQVLGYLQPITPQEIAQRHLVVTGFSAVDLVGQTGLEAEYDSRLRGAPGTQTVAVNAAGDVTGTVTEVAGQAGRRPGHQHRREGPGGRAERAELGDRQVEGLRQQRQPGRGDRGDDRRPDRGHGQLPAVQPERLDQRHLPSRSSRTCSGTSSGEPILNYDTQGQYPPGSTFKVVTTAAAVANGYSINGSYACPATYSIDGHSFANDGEPGLGNMSFSEALIQSCDTVYYEIGYQMWRSDNVPADFKANPNAPVQKMQKQELDWGFGKPTGIDLPEEVNGSDPDPAVAVLAVEGQRARRRELVQGREGERVVRAADRVPGLPRRVHVGARPGGHRGDRPGLCHRDPAAARQRLRRAGQRRHAVQPADR